MGTVTPGFHEVTAITFLLEKSVLETENIHNLLDDKEEINNLDSPVGVNNLACRIVTLFLEGYISARTAENTLDMLKQKITFSETAYLLPHFDEYKKEIREGLKALPHGKKNSTQKKD
jgi:hypothetical protein